MMLIKILCFYVFVANYVNAFHVNNDDNLAEDELKRKMLSYFEQSAWVMHGDTDEIEPRAIDGHHSFFDSPVTIIEPPKIVRTYITEIRVQQVTHPYLFRVMQMIPIKTKQTFEYVYKKLFRYFLAIQTYNPYLQINGQKILLMLRFIFPELTKDQIEAIAHYPVGYEMLTHILKIIFPGLPQNDWNLILSGVHTTPQLLVNLILYLCPNIKEHIFWKDNLSIHDKFNIILEMLFPGVSISTLLKDNDFNRNMYTFLESLFEGKLITKTPKTLEGPLWIEFQLELEQNQIELNLIPKDYLFFLFANYQTPEFQLYLPKIRDKFMDQKKMDLETMKIWGQYLKDLETHQKTLQDMPPEIKVFIKQYDNPKELIKILSNALGFEVDVTILNIPLDPKIQELWKKFILDLMTHKGDTTHLPQPLLEYFYSLSKNPNYKNHLDVIFDGLSISPHLVVIWQKFFDQLRDGQITLDQMPQELRTFLLHHQRPEEFLRIILKLKDSKINTNFLNVTPNPQMLQLWKKYVEDVAANKGKINNIPPELLKYFYEISSNKDYAAYIKLVFETDSVKPKTLNLWNEFIGKLKMHQVDLKDMPSELIQLMLKYKSPDEFFKVILPQYNIIAVPNDVVKEQWQDLTHNIQNSSLLEMPKELKDFFYQLTPSKGYQTTLKEIYSVNPDLLQIWKQFMAELKEHKTYFLGMPNDLKPYLYEIKDLEGFVHLIYQGMEPPLEEPIPKIQIPIANSTDLWDSVTTSLKKMKEPSGVELEIKLNYVMNLVEEVLRNVTKNSRYQQELSYMFQMDPKIITELENLKAQMETDYNVSISSMSRNLSAYFLMNLPATLQTIQGAYSPDVKVKEDLDFMDYFFVLIKMGKITGRLAEDIGPQLMFAIKYYVKDSVIEKKVDEVLKLHESNRLISKLETVWSGMRGLKDLYHPDGVEFFVTFVEQIGKLYSESVELCDRRSRIVAALEKAKQGFAAQSHCSYEDLWQKYKH